VRDSDINRWIVGTVCDGRGGGVNLETGRKGFGQRIIYNVPAGREDPELSNFLRRWDQQLESSKERLIGVIVS
jgi:hypothetical protein